MSILINIQQFIANLLLTAATSFKVILSSGFFLKPSFDFKDKRCIIFGNGPSLEKSIGEYGSSLSDFQIICVNYFAETSLFSTVRPPLYVINAPELWQEDVDPVISAKGERLFRTLAEKTHWKMDFFIPYAARKHSWWQKILSHNKNLSINYMNNTPVEGFRWFRYMLYNAFLGMPRPHNVLIPSLMLALTLKFREIYLFGTDHSWMKDIHVTEDNEVLLNQKHFYDKNTSTPKSMHYLGKGRRKLHEVLQKFVYAFKGYIEINEYSIKRGQEIINCTEGSYIDAFKRRKIID